MTNPSIPGQVNSDPSNNGMITAAMLRDTQLDVVLRDMDTVNLRAISAQLRMCAATPDQNSVTPLQFLAVIAGYHVEPYDVSNPFRPQIVSQNRRTSSLVDLPSAQITELATFVKQVAPAQTPANIALHARLADVVWVKSREDNCIAELATRKYCECVHRLLVRHDCTNAAPMTTTAWGHTAKEMIVRASRISHATRWKLDASATLKSLVPTVLETAYESRDAKGLARIADIAIGFMIMPRDEFMPWLEQLATNDAVDPLDCSELWNLLARCYHYDENKERERECLLHVANHLAKHADAAARSSPIHAINLYEKATIMIANCNDTLPQRKIFETRIQEIRNVKGKSSLHPFGILFPSHFVSAPTIQLECRESALASLVSCDSIPTVDMVKMQAKQYAKSFPIQNEIALQNYDYQGRTIFTADNMAKDIDNVDKYMSFIQSNLRRIDRYVTVKKMINPLRVMMAESYSYSDEYIQSILTSSPVVPTDHDGIIAQGVVRFIIGEDISASSILVPQLEGMMRHVLRLIGVDTTTPNRDGITQSEATLDVLLRRHSEELGTIIPKHYLREIDLLFNFLGGPVIRQQQAHGTISAPWFWVADAVYASWFILHMALFPSLGSTCTSADSDNPVP